MPVEEVRTRSLIMAQPTTDEEIKAAEQEVDYLFTYQPWTDEQVEKGQNIRRDLAKAYVTILVNVPPSPTRTRALNLLMDARQLANAALTFGGEY